jgi:hypothetical protein
MWSQHSERSYVLEEIKPIFCVSKLTGLFPVSFVKDPLTADESVDIRISANISGIICSIAMFCVIVGGVLTAIIQPYDIDGDPGGFVIKAFCIPAMCALALVSIMTNATINRQKLSKLITKLKWINEEIRNHSVFRHEKEVKRFSYLISVALVVVFVFLCYTITFRGKSVPLLYCVSTHVAKFLGVIIVIQFCKFVNCIRFSLEEIVKIISVYVAEDSTDNHRMFNENSRKCPTIEGSRTLTAPPQMSMYNGKELFPGKIGVPLFINLIHYKHTELHDIIFCRKIYSKIYDSVLLISSMYGITILLEYMSDCSALISTIYFVIMNVGQSTKTFNDVNITAVIISSIGANLMVLSTILYVSLTCHLATLECKKICDIIEKLLLMHPINKDLLQELQLFSNQMSKNRIKFTAFWFFVVDMKNFVTFMASALTYLIVLIQLK